MKIILNSIMVITLTFFTFVAFADNEQPAPVNGSTTPATIPAVVQSTPDKATVTQAVPSNGAPSPAMSAVNSALDNERSEMKKCLDMINSLSSQINDLKDQTLIINKTVMSVEDMAKSNIKIVLSCLVALLILNLMLLFKRCSCATKPDTIN